MTTFSFLDFFGSQLFANIVLVLTVLVALQIGHRQILLGDVVEIYASPGIKEMTGQATSTREIYPIINLQNVGTRVVYLDKYIFNGIEYIEHGQILPPLIAHNGAGYWIDLPTNGQNHVSLTLHYHDVDNRKWKTSITADLVNGAWKITSLPRVSDK